MTTKAVATALLARELARLHSGFDADADRFSAAQLSTTAGELIAGSQFKADLLRPGMIWLVDDSTRDLHPAIPSDVVLTVEGLLKQDPEVLDLLLFHELVHVHQLQNMSAREFLERAQNESDLLARSAVIEGHADYLTHRLACEIGYLDAWSRYSRLNGYPDASAQSDYARMREVAQLDLRRFAYVEGRRFVAHVLDQRGLQQGTTRLFSEPAPSLMALSLPDRYLAGHESARRVHFRKRLEALLAVEYDNVASEPLPITLYVQALEHIGRGKQSDAVDGARRFSASGSQHPAWCRITVNVVAVKSPEAGQALFQAMRDFFADRDIVRGSDAVSAEGEHVRVLNADGWLLRRTFGPARTWGEHRDCRASYLLLLHWGHFYVELQIMDPGFPSHVTGLARRLILVLGEDGERPLAAALDVSRRLRRVADQDAELSVLRGALDDSDIDVRSLALARLTAGAIERKSLNKLLHDPSWQIRWTARRMLLDDLEGQPGERQTVLLAGIRDESPAARVAVLRYTARRDLVKSLPWRTLKSALGDPSKRVRETAFELLGHEQIGGWSDLLERDAIAGDWQGTQKDVLAALSAGLRDESPHVRAKAARLLWHMDNKRLPLAKAYGLALQDQDTGVQVAALGSLLMTPLEGMAPKLVPVLENARSAETRAMAARVLAHQPDAATALPALRALKTRIGDSPSREAIDDAIRRIEASVEMTSDG